MDNLLPIGIGAILLGGIAVFAMQVISPPEPAGHSMTPPDTSKIAEGAPIADVLVPAKLSANAQIGKNGFDAKCATCHGENAAGQNGIAPPLVHKFYEPSHNGDVAFQIAARNGVRAHRWKFGNMPPVEGLTDADVAYITLYVRELQRENGIN
ncbi:cytochrome c [Tropicimonas sp. IMCC6043]|uniref:c-type cytochrome n=1 Tax=Tropicimonas sp. IMCC6043 TaxID=2510645 RepID=UPI00101C9B7A|nr:c-type cytochrome [Tropicimonas sp. IMCC6043]RYH05996.1 c-type cytochrome [Tropicimonas sp. IMCC6043]